MKRHWRWLVCGIVLGILAYAVRQVDWGVALATMRRASLLVLLLALILNGASLCLRGIRWWVFLRAARIGSIAIALRGVIVACGLNNLVIANAGEAARIVYVVRSARVSTASVLATVALDRLFDPICFGILLLVGALTVPLPPALSMLRVAAAVALAAAAVLLVLLVRAPKHRSRSKAARGWRRQLWTLRACVIRLSSGTRFGIALLLSAGVWLLQIAEYAAVAWSLGVSLPFAASVAAMIVINAGLLLRATPGGIGYFEFAYAMAVSHFGVSADVAVAIALLIQMIEIIPVTAAALLITLVASRARTTVHGVPDEMPAHALTPCR